MMYAGMRAQPAPRTASRELRQGAQRARQIRKAPRKDLQLANHGAPDNKNIGQAPLDLQGKNHQEISTASTHPISVTTFMANPLSIAASVAGLAGTAGTILLVGHSPRTAPVPQDPQVLLVTRRCVWYGAVGAGRALVLVTIR
jgi:hypothetical protein